MKGLLCNILQSKNSPNCSNHGISARYDKVILVDAQGPFEPNENTPAVRLGNNNRAYPLNEEGNENTVGPMFGGCFIWSSDSRFPSNQPIPLHDRWETQEQYNILST